MNFSVKFSEQYFFHTFTVDRIRCLLMLIQFVYMIRMYVPMQRNSTLIKDRITRNWKYLFLCILEYTKLNACGLGVVQYTDFSKSSTLC